MISVYHDEFQGLNERYRSTFFNAVSGFKNLAMVGTYSPEGIPNLGLMNSIFHLGANPFLLGMVLRPPGPEHETLPNIKAASMYTINLVTEVIYTKAHQTSARYEKGVSEFLPCGLTEWVSTTGWGPYVQESPIKIGMHVRELVPVPLNQSTIVIGEVMEIHLDHDSILGKDGFIDLSTENIVNCVGLDAYYLPVLLDRLRYAKPDQKPERLPQETYRT